MKIKRIKTYFTILLILLIIIFIYFSYKKDNFTNPPRPRCSTNIVSCATKVYDIIICIGQSNMTGPFVSNDDIPRSYYTDPLYIDDINYVIHPKVDKVLLDMKNRNTVTICQSSETQYNYSMATSFAREYAKRTNRHVLIINVSHRSSGILKRAAVNSQYLWQKTNSPGGLGLYPIAKDFINLVKTKICNTSKVVAICYQGSEEDSYLRPRTGRTCAYQLYDNEYINNYNSKITDLLNSFKREIGNNNTKIMIGGLLLGTEQNRSGHPCSEFFTNNVLKYVATINNYKFVSTDSNPSSRIKYLQRRLDGNGKNVHFNKLSQIELGKRYFYYYFN